MKHLRFGALLLVLSLAGCSGPGEPFEPRTYGVRNSQWYEMNTTERFAAKQSYLQEQSLAEQRRLNNLLREQNEEIRRAKLDADYTKANQQRIDQINREARMKRDQQRLYDEAQNQRQLNSESLAVEEAKRRSVVTHQREQAQREQAQRDQARREQELYNQQQRSLQAQEQRAMEEAQRQSLLSLQREQAQRDQTRREQELRQQQQQRLQAQEQRAVEEAQRQSLITHQREQARRQQLQAQEDRDIAEATRRSLETYNAERQAHNTSHATNNWQPNEGQLVRAGEIVMNQQRELGRQPSKQEMQQKMQSQMGITLAQSSTIIDELGLY